MLSKNNKNLYLYKIKKIIRNKSNSNNLIKNIYLLANKHKVTYLKNISDEKFAKLKFKENTGQTLNLDNPTSYNEKLWWLKLNNRDPLTTICSDKAEVRNYVSQLGLSHILVNIHGIYNNVEEIDFQKLPDKAFIKCTHGSGTNIIFDRSKKFDEKNFKKKFGKALSENYYYQAREWNYKDIKPRIIVEEYLDMKSGGDLVDYRFMCFQGEVKMIFADIGTAASDGSHHPDAKRNVYDHNFNYLDVKVGREQFPENLLSKPKNLEEMKRYAEQLSKPFKHCRVDLYNLDGEILFGEITFYPGGGTQKISPELWNLKMGSWIDIVS